MSAAGRLRELGGGKWKGRCWHSHEEFGVKLNQGDILFSSFAWIHGLSLIEEYRLGYEPVQTHIRSPRWRLHQYSAFGGQGLRRTGPFLGSAVEAIVPVGSFTRIRQC